MRILTFALTLIHFTGCARSLEDAPIRAWPARSALRTWLLFSLITAFALAGCDGDSFTFLDSASEAEDAGGAAADDDAVGGDTPDDDAADDDTTGDGAAGAAALEFRTIDGTNNNPNDSMLNAAHTRFRREMENGYVDGVSQMSGVSLKSPREISNIVSVQEQRAFNDQRASEFVWQWGQFLDHDLVLTEAAREPAHIAVPRGDRFFDPRSSGNALIMFDRSIPDPDTGTGRLNPREQMNSITGWIDASNVYGSDTERAEALRTLDGTGRLKTSEGNLLPFNTTGLPNAGGTGAEMFLAGDIRSNEQVALTALHTVFVREHNRIADLVSRQEPLSDEEIYQRARRIVGAQMQVVTYNEFLPVLLGRNALAPYRGYDPTVDAAVTNEFAAAIFRFGHSMLGTKLMRLARDGDEIEAGDLELKDAFFAPQQVVDHGIEPLLRGLAARGAQAVDNFVVDDVRNFLFGPPGAGGFDLAALNIQRGRDHGLPSYNQARRHMGLTPAVRFSDVSSSPEVQKRLRHAYDSVDDIELWVGALAEDRVDGALVGELVRSMLTRQFEALRDGDRFWYENQLEGEELEDLESTTLADIIRRNTDVGSELQRDVFRLGRR